MNRIYIIWSLLLPMALLAQADIIEEEGTTEPPAAETSAPKPEIPGMIEKNKIEFYALPGNKRLRLKVESGDQISGVRSTYVKINDSAFLPDNDKPFYLKRDGFYRVEWYSEDQVLNRSGHGIRNIYLDSTAPEIEQNVLDSRVNKRNEVLETARLSLAATDAGIGLDKIEWQNADKGNWESYSAPIGLREQAGEHGTGTIHIRAIDKLGNATPLQAFQFKISSGPAVLPAALLDDFPEDAQPIHIPAEGYEVGEVPPDSLVEYKIDNGEFIPVKSGERIQNLPPGEHTITWRYTDDLGRVVEKTYRIVVDTDPPETILRPSVED